MQPEDFSLLLADLERELLSGAHSVGILGLTPVTLQILGSLDSSGLLDCITSIYTPAAEFPPLVHSIRVCPLSALENGHHDVLVVADDRDKEDLLRVALPLIQGTPKLILAGYAHFDYRDPVFLEEVSRLDVPSLANGYPYSLTHIFQCLANGARLGLHGAVAEFGMFRGGTTMFMSRAIERLGASWPIIGFDTFTGFPPRRSPLDMYDHPDCGVTDLASVQRYLAGRNGEIVAEDIIETSARLHGEDLVLTFIDTDNYSSAEAALRVVQDQTVIHGTVILDHVAGGKRFRYTLGERMASRMLEDDPRYFHLHATGVFYRQY